MAFVTVLCCKRLLGSTSLPSGSKNRQEEMRMELE
ncbi:hypothetical protein PIIN_11667 [Serendipita indica DSM 11827]|uniref:Uncharacterized protein n=1 Tax=Serendipita indica (strain DSM 11827) TaxID=1109443 RepID=G4U296_SERID|nr:hypothetical protein PIIN_11667 [Serendipita indica DSM 11827]